MESVFKELDQNSKKEFWVKPSKKAEKDIEKNKVFSSPLRIPISANKFKKREFILTSSTIYCMSSKGTVRKSSKVNWKVIEPFTETNGKEKRLGFRLYGNGVHEDFYTKDLSSLDKWIEAFSKICIFQDLDNDYEIIKEIGTGSTSQVYLANDLENSQKVAIKKISKREHLTEYRRIVNLLDEIEILRKLTHPAVSKLHKVYEDEEFVSLVLDYVSEEDCFERLDRLDKFSEKESARFIKNLLLTVKHIHSKGIAHRDIKPENIMMSPQSNIDFKLIDFGYACKDIKKNKATQRCGSPGYMAPEIFKGKPYGPEVDVFSIGILLYTLLSGIAPFWGEKSKEVLKKNLKCKIEYPADFWGNISILAKDLVMQMTAPDPEDRITVKEALKHPWLQAISTSSFTSKKDRHGQGKIKPVKGKTTSFVASSTQ